MRTEGLEPSLPYEKRILSPLRLPFRHVRTWASRRVPRGVEALRETLQIYFDKTWPQASSQSLPLGSVTLPSLLKNLFGTWKIASIRPPFGHQAE